MKEQRVMHLAIEYPVRDSGEFSYTFATVACTGRTLMGWGVAERSMDQVTCPVCRKSWEFIELSIECDGNHGAKVVSTLYSILV